MSDLAANVSERMRAEWNQRAREDAHFYVAFGARGQDEADFSATVAELLPHLELELKRLPQDRQDTWGALEIGCGPARLMKPLSARFAEIHGVDVSDEMVARARERLTGIPHAHVHATDGASLSLFAAESFDFVYSYAVFQHIPSREVVFQYLREVGRVLKPGGVFRGQFNGLPHSQIPDTWAGVTFTAEDIREFTREQRLQLLALEGVHTQYMWTTWRRFAPGPALPSARIKNITNASSYEPAVPKRARHSAISVWVANLPEECDLNNLEVLVDGAPADPYYVGWPLPEGAKQVNAWLPAGVRTGLLPVELRMGGELLCPAGIVRVIPAGPLVPQIVSVSDGFNLVEKNISSSGVVKIHIEEIGSAESLHVTVDRGPVGWLEVKCTDPRPPRYEINLGLPRSLSPGSHTLEIQAGQWQLQSTIDFRPEPPRQS